ncbi:MAG: hypothetical protein AB7Q97_25930 [Gammaproteobacteria bacterium]
MMRRLLGDPRAVGLLLVLTALAWWWQLRGLDAPPRIDTGSAGQDTAGEAIAALDEPGVEVQSANGTPATAPAVPTALAWTPEGGRDPFSFHRPSAAAPSAPATPPATGSELALPRLDALIAGPATRLAVIDGAIRGRGDAVGGYRVAAIDGNRVRLAPTDGGPELLLSLP